MPGLPFHLTARIGRKDPLFVGVEAAVERIIVEGIASSDSLMLAYVVMPNHFHVIIRQGQRSLGWVMQPIMRRLAMLIQRTKGIEGHVFERRFRSLPFQDALYLRRSIVYADVNPHRARLCAHPSQYAWGSFTRYTATCPGSESAKTLIPILQLFAQHASDDLEYLRAAYLKHVEWRIAKDSHDRAGIPYDLAEPSAEYGDHHFETTFRLLPSERPKPSKDLRDRATSILEQLSDNCSVNDLRRRSLPRWLSPIRDALIAALLQAGYAGGAIASFLRISDSKVSQVAIDMRYGPLL
jgi:putative transposase